jgi:hypothetical protein
MKKFTIVPLSGTFAQEIRETMTDEFGHKVIEQVATGHGPCRVSLRPFKVGVDKRLLLSHSPFEINNVFDQPGPIFIHQMEVEP